MTMTDFTEPETRAASARAIAPEAGAPERNEVFVNLVQGDNAIVGLVANSIYRTSTTG